MISNIKHKQLEALYLYDQTKGVQQAQVRRLKIILQVLNAAVVISDIDRPGLTLHKLTGDLAGLWAVKVDKNYRVVFSFADGQVFDVDLVDYH